MVAIFHQVWSVYQGIFSVATSKPYQINFKQKSQPEIDIVIVVNLSIGIAITLIIACVAVYETIKALREIQRFSSKMKVKRQRSLTIIYLTLASTISTIISTATLYPVTSLINSQSSPETIKGSLGYRIFDVSFSLLLSIIIFYRIVHQHAASSETGSANSRRTSKMIKNVSSTTTSAKTEAFTSEADLELDDIEVVTDKPEMESAADTTLEDMKVATNEC